MSDDDYSDVGAEAEDEYAVEEADEADEVNAEAEPDADAEAEAEADEDAELGLDEDAAGTDVETDADESGLEDLADEAGQARPAKPNPDPPARKSNKPVAAVLVHPDDRVTDNCLRRTEAAGVLAVRAQEIAKYATNFTTHEGLHDPVAIAYKELFERRCPLKLRRLVGAGPAGEQIYEEWSINSMTLPALTPPASLSSGLWRGDGKVGAPVAGGYSLPSGSYLCREGAPAGDA